MQKSGKKYSIFQSTIFRIMIVIIILVLPVNILTIVFSTMMVRNSQEQVSKEIQNSLDSAMANLEVSLKSGMRQLTYLSTNDSDFSVTASKAQKENKTEQFFASFQNTRDTLDDLKLGYESIDLMYFSFPDTGYIISSGYPGSAYMGYRELISEIPQKEDTEGMHWECCDIGGVSTLMGYDSWKNMCFGVMLNLERTLDRMNLVQESEGRTVFLMNAEAAMFTENGSSYLETAGMTVAQAEAADEYLVFRSELKAYDLVLVEIMEKKVVAAQFPVLLKILQILSVSMAVVVIPMLLYYMSRVVNRPLNRLIRAIDRIEQGDLDYRIEESGQGREFEQINRSFNSMMEQVKNLKIDVYETELEKKDIKMRYLSQQIQPHFILNAMNLIYSYEPEEYGMIQKMILCISKYFRYVVKVNADFVELSQEMGHIRNYFEIQKARFPELFYSIVEYEEGLSKALMPPLIIQNFAENAIKHSLKIGNRITIFVIADYDRREGEPDRLRIRLADTGEGISDELIEKIELFKKTGKHQAGLGVGIENVIERLKYLYEDRSSVRVWRDEYYGGTNVEILVPVYFDKTWEDGINENTADR